MMCSSSKIFCFIIMVISINIVFFQNQLVEGSSVQWTMGPDQQKHQYSGKETAATAPRSQKYWDENGIERPDYAKTDYELARERLQKQYEKFGDQGKEYGKRWDIVYFMKVVSMLNGSMMVYLQSTPHPIE